MTAALLLAVLLPAASVTTPLPEPSPEPSPVQALADALAEYDAGARFPLPALSEAQLERLAAGKVVKIRERDPVDDDAPQRGVGLLRADHAAADLWLAARDVHYTSLPELTEVRLTPNEVWPAVWYQFLDLPRPFSDRHWVVDVEDNHALAAASGGRCWEHAWVLNPDGPRVGADAVAAGRIPGIDAALAAEAIYTPVNHGAWLVIDLGDGTSILGYHATSVIGGAIPDGLVADYMMFTLGSLLKGVVERTPEVLKHYDVAHEPIEGGDGVPLLPRTPSPSP